MTNPLSDSPGDHKDGEDWAKDATLTAERDEAIGNAQHAIHQAEQLTARAKAAEQTVREQEVSLACREASLLELELQVENLAARAEAAEAQIRDATAILDRWELAQSISRDGGKTFQPWPFVKRVEIAAMAACDQEDAHRAEALAARIAKLEAALWGIVALKGAADVPLEQSARVVAKLVGIATAALAQEEAP